MSDGYDFEGRRSHAYNKIDWHVPKSLRGRFLDIGCGPGNGLIAAIEHGFTMAVGVDRDFEEFPGARAMFEQVCRQCNADSSKILRIQANIFDVAFPPASFDCVMLLDSIEHLSRPADFIGYAADCLRPGGVLLLDTCPLYYSKAGHHLFNHFPTETHPWVHLRRDFEELKRARVVDDWSLSRFEELNKITHQEIRDLFEASGLRITQERRGKPNEDDLKLLDEHRPDLNLDGVDEALLFEDWILLVGERT